jgi:hypothetical protein
MDGFPAQFKFLTGTATRAELLVSVTSFGMQYRITNAPAAYNESFDAIIDSTLPYLFLPTPACEWLARQLSLKWDSVTGLYTINQTSLDSNRDNIDAFTISLGPISQGTSDSSINDTVVIKFPYDAFNATATWTWAWPEPQHIFPIRRAPSSTAILGRPFFQEAYVSADYERNVFNVSQAAPQTSITGSKIVNLYNDTSLAEIHSNHSSKLSAGAIVGIAVGGLIVLLIIAALLWFFCVKKKEPEPSSEKPEPMDVKDPIESPRPDVLDRRNTFESMSSSLTEMEDTGVARRPSMRHSRGVSELSSGSEETYADATGRTRSHTLDAIHELQMADKSDAAEYERMEMERRALETAAPAELYGEGHLL